MIRLATEFLRVDTAGPLVWAPQGETGPEWPEGSEPEEEKKRKQLTSYLEGFAQWLGPPPKQYNLQPDIPRAEFYTNRTIMIHLRGFEEEAEQTGIGLLEPVVSPLFEIWRNTAMAFEEISVDHQVLAGEPRIAGTRVPVSTIVGMFADGYSFSEVLDEFPNVSEDSIRQALLFCVRLTSID